MNYQQEKAIIETHFSVNWPHTPVAYENSEESHSEEWVRIVIQNGEAFQASLGDNPVFRYPGIVIVQIFTPNDAGSGRAVELADYVEAIFKNLSISGIQFRVPQVRRVNNETEWYQINVSTDFYRG